jgi:hypothetical protein
MLTYTFHRGKLTPGLVVQMDDKLGWVVYLGEEGRGRRFEKVALYGKNPAEVVNEMIYEAHPVGINVQNRELERPEGQDFDFYVLAKPDNPKDPRIIVRVNTGWQRFKRYDGWHETHEGQLKTLIAGQGAHGEAGRVATWLDSLVIMSPGDALKIYPEYRRDTAGYLLQYSTDKVVTCITLEEHDRQSPSEEEEYL